MIPANELQQRIDAVQPPYARDGGCVLALRDALVRLSTAETRVVVGAEEKDAYYLFEKFDPELSLVMNRSRGRGHAPRCEIVHSGGTPQPPKNNEALWDSE